MFRRPQTPSGTEAGCKWTLQLALLHVCRRHAVHRGIECGRVLVRTNVAGNGSALGYIPEVVWNESANRWRHGLMGFRRRSEHGVFATCVAERGKRNGRSEWHERRNLTLRWQRQITTGLLL